jgi:CheY-like chemotaxis protein
VRYLKTVQQDLETVRFDLDELEAQFSASESSHLPPLAEHPAVPSAGLREPLEVDLDEAAALEAFAQSAHEVTPQSGVAVDIEALVQAITPKPAAAPSGAERRRRTRAKIAFRVHVRGGVGTLNAFEDIVTSLDASRDGLLLSSSRNAYFVGEVLQVTFPYWSTPTAINQSRRAKVVRCSRMHDSRYAVALQFEESTGNDNDTPWVPMPFPNQVRVLGVESNLRMGCEIRELLEQDGYNVVIVSTPQQALDILRYETPDVLLAEADPRHSEISGHDLCAIVKKNDRLHHIPVILLTSSAMPSDYAASYKLGAVMCMMRPCQPQLLQRAVHLVAAPPTARTVYSGKFNMAPFVRTA